MARVLQQVHLQLSHVPHELILTLNIDEDTSYIDRCPPSLVKSLRVIRNSAPKGFGSNHNSALRNSPANFVAMADPDLGLPEPVFSRIESSLLSPQTGVVSPLARTTLGEPEDNGRPLPTPLAVFRRQFGGREREKSLLSKKEQPVEWLAGLFLAMRRETFQQLGGFDESYWMYCEDVDLCLRARQLGFSALLLGDVNVHHDARRRTLRNRHHLLWHLQSLLRLWRSAPYSHALKNRLAP